MKILFIIDDFVIEPLGIMYLSSSLKAAGHETEIVKSLAEDVFKKISGWKPDIVAYSLTTGYHQYYLKLNREIKEKFDVFSVFGGPHPTFFPQMIEEPGVDAICIGEGEDAMVEFTDRLAKGEAVDTVKNFWIQKDGKTAKNQVRPLIEDLNSIPLPDREMVYKYESAKNNPIKNFLGMRGCPFNCPYCFNHAYYVIYENKGKRVRLRSVDNLLKEVKKVKDNYPLGLVYFQDDTFILYPKWIKEFSKKYKEEIGLPFHCHVRADLVTGEIIQQLKDAGCHSVTFSIEAGNDEIRMKMLRRPITREQLLNASRIIRKAGIKLRIENMIGLPDTTLANDYETLMLNIQCRPDLGWASIYQPYPKTDLGERAKDLRLYNGDFDDIKPSFFEGSIMNIKNRREVNNLHKLFALTVEFPFLRHFLPILIRLPENRLYKRIYKSWKEHCYSKRLYRV